ncbi:hypothetical protein SteCoe_13059 [Stentor coeruleus]|uniref:C2H2-type domain-containing protein n=1 Tax=Stentor coeruleus TaxID=5963 RepID=A0A1R2C994_9CILI|nr:hypothetical protein SteCoe_13059 [Stentor coeruleus]
MESIYSSLKLAFDSNVQAQNIIVCFVQENTSNIDGVQPEIISPSKIYSCQYCCKNFATGSRLNKHLKKYPNDLCHRLKYAARRNDDSLLSGII